MQALDDALERFQSAHELTRELIEVYLGQYPELRDIVIDDLINNTDSVVGQYGEFFSPERRLELELLLAAADDQREEENLETLVFNLGVIADELQTELMAVWDTGGPLQEMASKLEFIFGDCAAATPNLLTSAAYFADLPVAGRILQEGDDAQYCAL